MRAAMAPEDLLISDVGAHKLWLGRLFPAYEPNTVIISNGFATMGIALPGAIAAKLAFPERRVVGVAGDGGFLMNLQEIGVETATQLGLFPLVMIVWVDGAYGVIGWKQDRRFGRTESIHFGNPRFAELATAFGWVHREATDAAFLGSQLTDLLEGEGPALITAPIDYRQNVLLAAFGEPALGA